jgi:hypothetical protein
MVWLEGSDKLKKCNDLIRTQTHDIPAFSIVHQPTTLLRALKWHHGRDRNRFLKERQHIPLINGIHL